MIPIVQIFTDLLISIISTWSYPAIAFLMALESANLPVPSEVVMLFAGYLVYLGKLDFVLVAIAGTIGNLIGSIVSYYLGVYVGRPVILKYGKYALISKKKLDWATDWFQRYGHKAVFISRMLPVIRTFISLPAGIARMNFKKFVFYTFIGSLPWNFALTYVGIYLGPNWESIINFFHAFDALILVVIIIFSIWYVWKVKNHEDG